MGSAKNKEVFFLNPYSLVSEFNLKRGDAVADFGCGAGHFVMAMARVVGKDGVVSAVDIRKGVLEVVDGHAKLENMRQVKTILGDTEKENGSNLQDSSQDAVLVSNVLHQSSNPSLVLKEALRVLREDGRLFVVDWLEDAPLGPPKRISSAKVEKLALDLGLTFEKKFNAGSTHYALSFRKKI